MVAMGLVLCLLASSVSAMAAKGGLYGVGFPYAKGGAFALNPWGFGAGPWGNGGFKGGLYGTGYPWGWGPWGAGGFKGGFYGNPWAIAPWGFGYPWGFGGFGKI